MPLHGATGAHGHSTLPTKNARGFMLSEQRTVRAGIALDHRLLDTVGRVALQRRLDDEDLPSFGNYSLRVNNYSTGSPRNNDRNEQHARCFQQQLVTRSSPRMVFP